MLSSRDDTPRDELAAGLDEAGTDEPARTRSVPRWAWRVAGGITVVVAGALFGPGLLASSDGPPRQPGPTPLPSLPSSRFASETPRPEAPLDWKVRGDLAHDQSFLSAALARVRKSEAAAAKVLFAGTLPDGGRIAFVALARSDPVSDMGRGVHMRALHVRRGVRAADATPLPIGRLMEDEDVTGWAARSSGGRVFAVVLSSPAPLSVEASPLIRYHRDGGASRRWQPIWAGDGSAVVDLGTRSDQIVVVRSSIPESRTYPLVLPVDRDPRGDALASGQAPDVSRVDGLSGPTYRGPDPDLLVDAVAEGHEHRFDPATADLRILWSGEVEPQRPAALVRARRPDGPVFQLLVIGGGPVVALHGPRHVPWSEGDVTPWLFVQGDPEKPVLLLNPSGRGTASVTEAGAPTRIVRIDSDGVGVVTGTKQGGMFTGLSGARLVIVAPDAQIVVSSSLSSLGIDDVFVLR